jgi:hypothetical protein
LGKDQRNEYAAAETYLAMIEIIIWGEQNDTNFFEYVRIGHDGIRGFLSLVSLPPLRRMLTRVLIVFVVPSFFIEKDVLGQLLDSLITAQSRPTKLLLLKTVNILVENIQSSMAICAWQSLLAVLV